MYFIEIRVRIGGRYIIFLIPKVYSKRNQVGLVRNSWEDPEQFDPTLFLEDGEIQVR